MFAPATTSRLDHFDARVVDGLDPWQGDLSRRTEVGEALVDRRVLPAKGTVALKRVTCPALSSQIDPVKPPRS